MFECRKEYKHDNGIKKFVLEPCVIDSATLDLGYVS